MNKLNCSRFVVLFLFSILLFRSAPAGAYVILHDRHDEFMNYASDKGMLNVISLSWGSSLVDMKAEDKMDKEEDLSGINPPPQVDKDEKIRTYTFLNLEYSLENSPWFSFALGAAQSIAQMQNDKSKKAIKYSDYYFGKCIDIFKGKNNYFVGATGISVEAEYFRDNKNVPYIVRRYTPDAEDLPVDRKRDSKFKMFGADLYADAAAFRFLNIASFRAGFGYMTNDKLNSTFNYTNYDYDYYSSSATATYFNYGFTLGLKAGIFLVMMDIDCKTSISGKIEDKNALNNDIGYGTMAIVSPTSMVDKNFFKDSRGSLVFGFVFTNVKLLASVGADYVNLHYRLKEDKYETSSFIKVDAKLTLTVMW